MSSIFLKIYWLIFLFVCSICTPLFARNYYTYLDNLDESYLAIWGALGYAQLDYSLTNINDHGSYACAYGIGYEFHRGRHLITAIGAELSIFGSGMHRVGAMADDHDMIDNDISSYSEFTMHATFNDFKETNRLGYINIPIMVGYRVDPFYALGGVKLGFDLFSNYKTNSLLTTTGEYEWFFDDFEDMPNHYFVTDNRIDDSGKVSMGFNVSLSGELGYYLSIDKNQKNDLRIGLQVDYGLININQTNKVNEQLFTRTENPIEYQLNSVFSTSSIGKVNLWVVEVKLTYLICTKSKWNCHCN